MRESGFFLILLGVIILLLPGESAAQQKLIVTTGTPVTVVTKDGTYKICVEGELKDKAVNNPSASVLNSKAKKSGSKENGANGTRRITIAGSENLGKNIKYGPWRMLNNFNLPSYSYDEYFSYGNRDKVRNEGVKAKQISTVTPDQVSILKLSQSSQISVILGQQYSIQTGQFTFDKNAFAAMQKITAITTLPVLVLIKNGIYHILIEGFPNLKEANLFNEQLSKIGYQGTIVKVNNPLREVPSTHKLVR